MSFVLVQHLNPTHHSVLTELFSKKTARAVKEVTDGMVDRAELRLRDSSGRFDVDFRPYPQRHGKHKAFGERSCLELANIAALCLNRAVRAERFDIAIHGVDVGALASLVVRSHRRLQSFDNLETPSRQLRHALGQPSA